MVMIWVKMMLTKKMMLETDSSIKLLVLLAGNEKQKTKNKKQKTKNNEKEIEKSRSQRRSTSDCNNLLNSKEPLKLVSFFPPYCYCRSLQWNFYQIGTLPSKTIQHFFLLLLSHFVSNFSSTHISESKVLHRLQFRLLFLSNTFFFLPKKFLFSSLL